MAGIYIVNGLRYYMFFFEGTVSTSSSLLHAQRSWLKSYKSYGTQTGFDRICGGFLLMTIQSYSSLGEWWCIPWFVVVPFRWFTSLDNGKRIAVLPSQCWKCVGQHFLQSHFLQFSYAKVQGISVPSKGSQQRQFDTVTTSGLSWCCDRVRVQNLDVERYWCFLFKMEILESLKLTKDTLQLQ